MIDISLFREVIKSKHIGSVKFGDVYGYWKILDAKLYTVNYNTTGTVYVKCLCVDCNDIHFMQLSALKIAKKTNSGGCRSCSRKRNTPKGNQHFRWKGFGEIAKSYVNNISAAAKSRGIDFNVSMEYIWSIFLEQNRKCKISGVDIHFEHTGRGGTASLDRIDRTKGYIEGNVQWVHKIVNEMKWAKSDDELIEWCKIIAEYNR